MNIPIVMMFTDNFSVTASVAIYSLLKNANKEHFYKLHILHRNITSKHQEKLNNIVKNFTNASLEFTNMGNKYQDFDNINGYPVEIIYKICLPEIFQNLERIIVTDVDVVFMGDISTEYINFLNDNENYFAGVKQVQQTQHHKFSQNIKDDNTHFICGAGYMIFNLNKMRKENIQDKTLEFLDKYRDYCYYPEQDALSQICYPHIKLIHPKNMVATPWYANYYTNYCYLFDFDYCATKEEFEEALKNPIQLHYLHNGKQNGKPWINPHCAKAEIWWEELTHTPFFKECFDNLGLNEDLITYRLIKRPLKKLKYKIRKLFKGNENETK